MFSRRRLSPALVISLVALFFSLTGLGVAATGGNFILGGSNTADKTTRLGGTIDGDGLLRVESASTAAGSRAIVGRMTSPSAAAKTAGVVGSTASTNPSAAGVIGLNTGGGPGLSAYVPSGTPPLSVNSSTKVTDLNADLLDGLSSSAFVQSGAVGASSLAPLGSEAVPFVIERQIETGLLGGFSGADVSIYTANAPTGFIIADVWVIAGFSTPSDVTWQLRTATGGGGNAITPATSLPTDPGDVGRLTSFGTPLALQRSIAAGGTLVVRSFHNGNGNSEADFDLYLLAVPN